VSEEVKVKAHGDAGTRDKIFISPAVRRFSFPPILSLYSRACESQSVFASRSETGGGGAVPVGTESIVFPRPYFYITSLPVRVNVHRVSV